MLFNFGYLDSDVSQLLLGRTRARGELELMSAELGSTQACENWPQTLYEPKLYINEIFNLDRGSNLFLSIS